MEYFSNDFSFEVWSNTYRAEDELTIEDTWKRVSNAVAQAEDEKDREYWENQFYSLLENFAFVPGGRILSNAGNKWTGTTLMNCYVGPHPKYDIDSLDGILELLRMQSQTLKSEGGFGANFSHIRPRGSFIHGVGVESPGAVKYMELFNKSSDIITAGSGKATRGKKKIRKGAQMGCLHCWHPDVEEFITAKLQNNRLDKFNISVVCSNKFMKAVENNEEWNLIFPATTHEKYKTEWNGNIEQWISNGYPIEVYKTVKARDLWDLIMTTNYKRNDPGVLFLDRANETHCCNYLGDDVNISSTNPCGEQCMPNGASCDLGSLNLVQFVDVDNRCFDLEKIKKYSKILVRFLDNVNTVTNVPLQEYRDTIDALRRIGCGIMGWGSALYLLGVRFGSKEAEHIKVELMKTFTHSIAEESISLAEEKGMFNRCDPVKHSQHMFWRQIELPQHLINKMSKVGIRNSSLFSMQPTGNTGVLCNIISGGIEPIFAKEYIRTVIVHDIPSHIQSVAPDFHKGEFFETDMFKFTKEGEETILRGVDENGVVWKIDKNRGLTKEVLCEDYAVNLLKKRGEWNPSADWAVTTNDLTVEDHLTDLYGWGKWIDASMSKTVNLPADYPFEDYKKVYMDAYKKGLKGITTFRAGTMTNVLSEKTTSTISPSNTNFNKRPKILPAKIYHASIHKEKFFIAIGLLNNLPYEIFAGKCDKSFTNGLDGVIKKISRGKYIFQSDDLVIDDLVAYCTDSQEALTRLLSTCLRHNVDLSFTVQQLEKTKGDMQSFAKASARILKKYIQDGTKVVGEECPECQSSDLIRQSGCVSCQKCSWSKCS